MLRSHQTLSPMVADNHDVRNRQRLTIPFERSMVVLGLRHNLNGLHSGSLHTLISAGVLALCLDFIYTTAQILFDTTFLKGFGFFLVQVVLASAVGAGIGASLSELILRSRWITESAIRWPPAWHVVTFFWRMGDFDLGYRMEQGDSSPSLD